MKRKDFFSGQLKPNKDWDFIRLSTLNFTSLIKPKRFQNRGIKIFKTAFIQRFSIGLC
jgi:hypothetical protein